MNSNNVMNFVKPIKDVLNIFKAKLEAVQNDNDEATFQNVEIFPGASQKALFEYMPELKTPAAVIFHESSRYANYPRKTLNVSVIVLCETFSNTDRINISSLVDKSVEALDQEVVDNLLIKADFEQTMELPDDPTISAFEVIFEVQDH